jgi:alpha-D-ribose 1-methylphosphonate 5-triphosphate diphosphatase
MAFHHADLRAAACGLTTVLSCKRFTDPEREARLQDHGRLEDVEAFTEAARTALVRHYLQARWDPNFEPSTRLLDQVAASDAIPLLVYNESIPGNRQFRDLDALAQMRARRRSCTVEEARAEIDHEVRERRRINNRPQVSRRLKGKKVIGSHDDTTLAHVKEAYANGSTLCEMPTTLEAARRAKQLGMFVCMGAPNFLRGTSSYGNLSCEEAMAEDLVDILCSDYHFPAMPASFVKMLGLGMPAWRAVEVLSLNPARCLHWEGSLGSIEVGRRADLVALDIQGDRAVVRHVWVGGRHRFACSPPGVAEPQIRHPAYGLGRNGTHAAAPAAGNGRHEVEESTA